MSATTADREIVISRVIDAPPELAAARRSSSTSTPA
jgi:hypothetical protein